MVHAKSRSALRSRLKNIEVLVRDALAHRIEPLGLPAKRVKPISVNKWPKLEPTIRESLELATETPHWVACRARQDGRISLRTTAAGN